MRRELLSQVCNHAKVQLFQNDCWNWDTFCHSSVCSLSSRMSSSITDVILRDPLKILSSEPAMTEFLCQPSDSLLSPHYLMQLAQDIQTGLQLALVVRATLEISDIVTQLSH